MNCHRIIKKGEFCGIAKKGLKLVSFSQKLRYFAQKVGKIAGEENRERIVQWIKEKKKGWFSLLEDPGLPVTSTQLDQAHNAFDRKIFMMKGFHHLGGSHNQFVNGLAILHNLIPYQRRAKNAGRCGIQVEGGKLPFKDWFLRVCPTRYICKKRTSLKIHINPLKRTYFHKKWFLFLSSE